MKANIKDARPQIDDFRKLRFRNYVLKSDPDGREQLSVIAQEVMKVSPGLVSQTREGKGKHYEVSCSTLYLKAAKALQEATAIINDLQARVAKLEAARWSMPPSAYFRHTKMSWLCLTLDASL